MHVFAGVRVNVLNEKLAVAEDLVCERILRKATRDLLYQLDSMHDLLNTNAMDRITWIIIW